MNVYDKLKECGIVPVAVIEDEIKAEYLAQAVSSGGLNCIEITFRTKAAAAAMSIIKNKFPEMLVAAGTVLTVEQAQLAVELGADFLVSPGSNPKVIKYCLENDICIIPGVMTPTEIEKNLELGIKVMKFFPAECAGGVKMIKALSAPYKDVYFMPTGGINADNAQNYLECKKVIGCGGSWMVKPELIEKGNFSEIEKLSWEAAEIVKRVR